MSCFSQLRKVVMILVFLIFLLSHSFCLADDLEMNADENKKVISKVSILDRYLEDEGKTSVDTEVVDEDSKPQLLTPSVPPSVLPVVFLKGDVSAGERCQPGEKVEEFPFYVYLDAEYAGNHFFPTGHMGDYLDIKIDLYNKENPYSGLTCIKIIYTGRAYQGGKWTGLYWQDPVNNWGEKLGGYDLTEATKLTFRARGKAGGEILTTFKVGGIIGKYGDSGTNFIGPIVLTKKWTKYAIDLKNVTPQNIEFCSQMRPISRIIGGFAWATNIDVNHGGITFYLDEIRYEKD